MSIILQLIAFVLLASPASFRMTRKFLGGWIGNAEGLASMAGLILHAIVFLLVLRLVRTSGFATFDAAQDENNKHYAKRQEVIDKNPCSK
jgi:hypothetical protein